MALAKYTNELIQRVTCHFKPHTYFIHTIAPLPSIFIPLPNRVNLINPLLKQLVHQQNFNFVDKLHNFPIKMQAQSKKNKEQVALSSIYGLSFDDKTSFVIYSSEGKLTLSKTQDKQSTTIGVILYSTAQSQRIKTISSRNYQNIVIGLKISALLCVLWLQKELWYSTRLQNHQTS